MTRIAAIACGLALLATSATATDIITLKNGDRISGTIVKKEGEKIIINTPYVDQLSIEWKEVASVQSDTVHMVRVAPDNFVNARMKQSADGIVLEGDELRGTRTIRPEDIVTIDIPPGARWEGHVGVALGGAEGNTSLFGIAGEGEAIRKTDDDRLVIGMGGEHRRQKDRKTGAFSTSTSNVKGWALYDYNLDDHWSVGGQLRLTHDRPAGISLRTLAAAGPRYRVFDDKIRYLSFYLHLAYINENFVSPAQTDKGYISLALGDELRWKLTDSLSVYQSFDIYPNLQNTSDVLLVGKAGLRQQVAKGLYLGLGVEDDYDTVPALDQFKAPAKVKLKRNDFLYTASVGYEW